MPEKPKRGRPTQIPDARSVHVKLGRAERAWVQRQAEARGWTMSAVLRQLVLEAMDHERLRGGQ